MAEENVEIHVLGEKNLFSSDDVKEVGRNSSSWEPRLISDPEALQR